MVLTNAQRQARHRARLKALKETAVLPDDVWRAARLIYEDNARHDPSAPAWGEFVASLKGRQRALWAQWVPDDLDPAAYAGLAPDDAALCIKVAAVARAVRNPPE